MSGQDRCHCTPTPREHSPATSASCPSLRLELDFPQDVHEARRSALSFPSSQARFSSLSHWGKRISGLVTSLTSLLVKLLPPLPSSPSSSLLLHPASYLPHLTVFVYSPFTISSTPSPAVARANPESASVVLQVSLGSGSCLVYQRLQIPGCPATP